MGSSSSDPRHVVWVLGSGFSAPLGGPMLAQLLSLEARAEIAEKHDLDNLDPGVYWLYHYGRKFKDGWIIPSHQLAGANLWEHAEDFLDKLDAAIPRSELARLLNRCLEEAPTFDRINRDVLSDASPADRRLDEIRWRARRYVAAECCQFLRKTSADAERWNPYTEWVAGLAPGDAIVTFNYDRVVESIHRPRTGDLLWIDLGAKNRKRLSDASVPVYKLHGSVDWCRDRDGTISQATVDFAEEAPPDQLVIATPGPTKAGTVSETLQPIWDRAMQALKAASAIVFVGYRFPPSDAHARTALLGAIRENRQPHLDLHVVLGPERTKDVVRLERMLEATARRAPRLTLRELLVDHFKPSFSVTVHPLWAEDFFSVLARAELLQDSPLSAPPAP